MLSRLIGFFLLPILTHHLTPEQYSVYTQFYIGITIGMTVIALGLDISLLRYYVLEKDFWRRKRIFSTVFWVSLFATGALTIAIMFKAEDIAAVLLTIETALPDWAPYTLRLCVVILALDILANYPTIVMRGENQAGRFTFVNIASASAQFVLSVVFVVGLKRGIAGIFEANLLSSVLRLTLCLPTIIERLRLKFDISVLRDCLAFGLPNVPNLLFVTLVETFSRWLLGYIKGEYENGLFSAAYRLGMFLSVVAMGFRYAWQPFFLQIAHRSDAKEVYARVLTYYTAIALWLFLLLTAWVEPLAKWNIPFIGYLIAPEYWKGLGVFPIVLLAHIFNGIYAVFMVGVYLEKKTHILPAITGFAATLNIAGNLLLIPRFGMWAAAWMTVASWAAMTILLYVYIQRVYPVRYEWGRILKLCFWAGIVFTMSRIGQSVQMDWLGWLFSAAFPLPLLSANFLTEGERKRLGTFLGLKL